MGFPVVSGSDEFDNAQGLLSLPYTVCVNPGQAVELRAFQDDDASNSHNGSEGAGRRDQTDNGNAGYGTVTVEEDPDGEEWFKERNINIRLDATTQ